jgi:hypothetical protein
MDEGAVANRARLVHALRKPLGFSWNFADAGCCAFAVMRKLEIPCRYEAIGLPRELGGEYFGFRAWYSPLYGYDLKDVTPAMVADKLEAAPWA